MSADVPPPPVVLIGPWGRGEGELNTEKIGGCLIRAADSYHFYLSQRCQVKNFEKISNFSPFRDFSPYISETIKNRGT